MPAIKTPNSCTKASSSIRHIIIYDIIIYDCVHFHQNNVTDILETIISIMHSKLNCVKISQTRHRYTRLHNLPFEPFSPYPKLRAYTLFSTANLCIQAILSQVSVSVSCFLSTRTTAFRLEKILSGEWGFFPKEAPLGITFGRRKELWRFWNL